MNDTPQFAKVIELFEKYRAAPGEPYDETHFLDYLLRAPAKPRAVYNSFGGLRRFNALIDDVQMEFAICFSLQDRDANYSLAKFLNRVAELEKSPRGSLASLANQEKAGAGWQFLVIADAILLLIAVWLRNNPLALAGVIVAAAVCNLALVRFVWKGQRYLRNLRRRIETAHANP